MRMFECVPYIKSICHQVWVTEWHHNHDDDVDTRKDDIDSYEVKDFYLKGKNSSLCVVDDLIVNVGGDEIIQERSSDVPKQTIDHGREHPVTVTNKEERKLGRTADETVVNSR